MRAFTPYIRALHQPVRPGLKLESKVPLLHVAWFGVAQLGLQVAAQAGCDAKRAAGREVKTTRERVAHGVFGGQTAIQRSGHDRNGAVAGVIRDGCAFYGDIGNAIPGADDHVRPDLVGHAPPWSPHSLPTPRRQQRPPRPRTRPPPQSLATAPS